MSVRGVTPHEQTLKFFTRGHHFTTANFNSQCAETFGGCKFEKIQVPELFNFPMHRIGPQWDTSLNYARSNLGTKYRRNSLSDSTSGSGNTKHTAFIENIGNSLMYRGTHKWQSSLSI